LNRDKATPDQINGLISKWAKMVSYEEHIDFMKQLEVISKRKRAVKPI
jgi:hypothetical protein